MAKARKAAALKPWQSVQAESASRMEWWLQELWFNRHEALERAVGMPLREVVGCGFWGCVALSRPPWAVKLTADPNEGPMWRTIARILQESGHGKSQAGLTRVKEAVRLTGVADVQAAYAVVREEIAPLWTAEGLASAFTMRKLGFAPSWEVSVPRADMVESHWSEKKEQGWVRRLVEDYGADPRRAPEAAHNLGLLWQTVMAIRLYKGLAREQEEAVFHPDVLTTDEELEEHERAMQELNSQLWTALLTDGGWVGNGLLWALQMLLEHGILLQDLHGNNYGWRVHETVPGFARPLPLGLCIFDPGGTKTIESSAETIPERAVRNPARFV